MIEPQPLTPAVLVDLDKAEANIARFQEYADSHGFSVRPHIKTHKLGCIAERQIAAGAVGITCQKISEAEAMVAASAAIRDVLITYNILGAPKIARLRALAGKVRVSVVADSTFVVDRLAGGFAGAAAPLPVLVECDTGAGRCGVLSPADAAALATEVHGREGLAFAGLMTYPPVGGGRAVQSFMSEARRLLAAQGIACERISSGGTPDMWRAHEVPVVTEYRPGTYVYNDRSLVERGTASFEDCALTVLATVVSANRSDQAIIDAGSKILTSDLLGLEGHGHVLGRPDIAVCGLSEEHGTLRSTGPIGLSPGDRIRIVPNHACVVTNMVDEVHFERDGRWVASHPVDARGRVI